jgi:hypothetical protein
MLNSDSRRPAFDRFFASLDEDFRGVFMDSALSQWHYLSDEARAAEDGHVVSLIDCMENLWDAWRELRHMNPSWFDGMAIERAIMAHMLDPERVYREQGMPDSAAAYRRSVDAH